METKQKETKMWTSKVFIRGQEFVAKCSGNVTHPQMVGRLVTLSRKGVQVWPKNK